MIVTALGRDRHGLWVFAPAGTERQGPNGPLASLTSDVIGLIPDQQWWVAAWFIDHPIHVYVDITTWPVATDGRITWTDLDLDVVRDRDGLVRVHDRDEFARHAVAYPDRVVDAARVATASIERFVVDEHPPFDGSHLGWLEPAHREEII